MAEFETVMAQCPTISVLLCAVNLIQFVGKCSLMTLLWSCVISGQSKKMGSESTTYFL
jgi:hypothetical protein